MKGDKPEKNASPGASAERRVLVGTGASLAWGPASADRTLVWRLLAVLALAIAIVGWTDLALLWYPAQFGNPEWEFGTVSAFLNGLPLGTIGLVLFGIAAIGSGWRRTTRVAALLILLVALAVIALGVVYLLDVPLAIKGTAPALHQTILKAIAKASIYAVTYAMLYVSFGIAFLRLSRTRAVH